MLFHRVGAEEHVDALLHRRRYLAIVTLARAAGRELWEVCLRESNEVLRRDGGGMLRSPALPRMASRPVRASWIRSMPARRTRRRRWGHDDSRRGRAGSGLRCVPATGSR